MTFAPRALGIIGIVAYGFAWLAVVTIAAFATYFFALAATSLLMSRAVAR